MCNDYCEYMNWPACRFSIGRTTYAINVQFKAFTIILSLFISLSFTSSQAIADEDARAVRQQESHAVFNKLSETNDSRFALASKECLFPGDVLTIKGFNLNTLNNYHLVLRSKRHYLPLKRLSISKQQIILQIPRDTELVPGDQYPIVLLLKTTSGGVSKPTGNTINICPTAISSPLLPVTEEHESGEILVLSHSGLVDPIIKQGTKLGYLLLRQYQLKSLNLTLLVLGGGDKRLEKAIKTLSVTFPEADVDYNHHFYISGSAQGLAVNTPHWPDHYYCRLKSQAKVTVGMLDGDIDLSHPALTSKSIKTKNFLLPGEAIEQEHATAIAALLVGAQPHDQLQGFVPFIALKAAKVVRAEKPTPVATAEAISRALDWFINEQVKLVNVSLTSPNPNKITNRLFEEAGKKGVIIFAAAGNDRKRLTPAYPGVLPNVITITAVDADGEIYSAANQGNYIDFAAPGVDIWTASAANSKGQFRSGTSLAVPYAVSVAAVYMANQPNYSQEALFQTMQHEAEDLGTKGYDNRYGWGQVRINHELCQQ